MLAKQADRIGYFDFYCGPGRYKDGTYSTPLLILERAIASKELARRLVTIFNDASKDATDNLEREIAKLKGAGRLKHKPQVATGPLSEELVSRLEAVETVPALSFIDPWGYKGLSSRLIRAAMAAWGCDVIFFFNYNRINMGIANPMVEAHMAALFGPKRLTRLRKGLKNKVPFEREQLILDALEKSVRQLGAPHVLPFTFRRDDGRVSHYICFISKHQLGYSIMKRIMAKEGAVDEDGVPLYEYYPSDKPRQLSLVPLRPILRLPKELQAAFAGEKLSVKEVYERHHVGTPFIKPNYKKALISMERKGMITCDRPAEERRKGTIADDVVVTFPP